MKSDVSESRHRVAREKEDSQEPPKYRLCRIQCSNAAFAFYKPKTQNSGNKLLFYVEINFGMVLTEFSEYGAGTKVKVFVVGAKKLLSPAPPGPTRQHQKKVHVFPGGGPYKRAP